ncbi:CAP domain-containing protein [Terrisporobacter glycolicus]|uniref:CAP domain-containing protein n=1 Tax=Terrisporobacter glycolicus TaxID=36841 RepID=UPI0034649578
MNKKLKTLLTAGLVTVIAGSSIVSSSALCKKTIDTYKTKGAIYLSINGKKYKVPLGNNNKPSKEEDSSTGNTGNNNKPNNNNTNTGNNNKPNNNNTNTGNNNKPNNNNTNTENNNKPNDNVVEKPNTDNNTSNNNQSTTGSFSSFQKEVTRLVNVERSKRGLSQLSFNSQLSNVATLKSQDMINKNYFSHTSPTYGSPFDMMKQFNISYRAAGENIAMGQRTPAEVVNAWMNSQGHRENILNPNFTDIGVGVAKSSNGTLYWTQMFIGK